MQHPWPRAEDRRRATAEARGDNARIAALAEQVSRYHRAGGSYTPTIPPIVAPLDCKGVRIALDCEVIGHSFRDMPGLMPGHWYRAKVVGYGDPGLPGREVLRVRHHGCPHTTADTPRCVEVHTFDDYEWVKAEEAAAHYMMRPTWERRKGVDLAETLWGGWWFDEFQRRTATHYAKAMGLTA